MQSHTILERIRKAYDLTVEQHNNGIDPFDSLPEDFTNSQEFIAFKKKMNEKKCSSNGPEIKKYLNSVLGSDLETRN